MCLQSQTTHLKNCKKCTPLARLLPIRSSSWLVKPRLCNCHGTHRRRWLQASLCVCSPSIGSSWRPQTVDPWADPKSRSTVRICSLHCRSTRTDEAMEFYFVGIIPLMLEVLHDPRYSLLLRNPRVLVLTVMQDLHHEQYCGGSGELWFMLYASRSWRHRFASYARCMAISLK